MMCDFTAEGHLRRCQRCGFTIVTDSPPERCHAKCRKPGLGDYVAYGLAVFGIKKKRGCGCNKRQDALNRVGEKLGL